MRILPLGKSNCGFMGKSKKAAAVLVPVDVPDQELMQELLCLLQKLCSWQPYSLIAGVITP